MKKNDEPTSNHSFPNKNPIIFKKILKNEKGNAAILETLAAFAVVMIIFLFFIASISGVFITYETNKFDMHTKNIDISEHLIRDPGKTIYDQFEWENHPDPKNTTSVLGLAKTKPLMEYECGEEYCPNPMSINFTKLEPYYETMITKTTLVPLNMDGTPAGPNETIYLIFQHLVMPDPQQNHTFQGNTWAHMVDTFSPYSFLKMFEQERFDYGIVEEKKINVLDGKITYEKAKEALGIGPEYDFNIVITSENGKTIDVGAEIDENSEIITTHSRSIVIDETPAKFIMHVFR